MRYPTNGPSPLQRCEDASEKQVARPYPIFKSKETRPDTRPIPVADGWAGAEMRVFTLSNSITMDRRTDGPTDGQRLL